MNSQRVPQSTGDASGMHAELRRTRDRVEELEAFSDSLSHDLRAPLQAITCFAQSLQDTERDRMSLQGQHRLDRVVQGALRMNRMIEDVLACSRAERGDLHWRDVDLDALAREVAGELRPRRARVEIGELPSVRGDGVMLRLVFANLVGNAFKFSTTTTTPNKRIDARDRGEMVEIRGRDN